MPAKQTISKKSLTKQQKLTPIESQLLECAKNGKPVLLYGETTVDRENLISEIQVKIGGIDSKFEYFDDSGNPTSTEKLAAEFESTCDKELLRSSVEYLCLKGTFIKAHAKRTERTFEYIDGGTWSDEKFFKAQADNAAADGTMELFGDSRSNRGYLALCKGTLFVDNLSYQPTCHSGEGFYCKLAQRIKDTNFNHLINSGIKRSRLFPRWFVIYFYGLKSLPQYFLEQFKVINLEAEKQKETVDTTPNTPEFSFDWSVKENENRIYSKGKLIATLSNIPFKLFAQLNKKSGQYVKDSTLVKCWDKEPNYVQFLTGTINKLKNTLKENLKQNGIETKYKIIEPKLNNKGKYVAYKLKP